MPLRDNEKIKLKNVSKLYGNNDFYAVTDFNLDIYDKEFIVFVGPSGCGKSTTLRMIAGLENVTKGQIYINGQYVNNKDPKDRNIAMVFQNYALYPHMSVYDNIAFGLQIRKMPKVEIERLVTEAASILDISDYLDRKPSELSGGERQRVALGRAIVKKADIFLMDEPLSNLDSKLRHNMRAELIDLHKKLNTTTIYVTHDQTEAMTMATRIVVMKDGIIQQIGTPMEIYESPNNLFVAEFIGTPKMNFIRCTLKKDKLLFKNHELDIPRETIHKLMNFDYEDRELIIGLRPEIIKCNEDLEEEESALEASIIITELLGHETLLHCIIQDVGLVAKVDVKHDHKTGEKVTLSFNLNHAHFFDPITKMAIL